jgi:acetylornithine deacetylase/succinyl-diaminopimelate desuccinylase family protein
MQEIDAQSAGEQIDLVICPVGDGSLAHAAVTHFKAPGRSTALMTVEPDTAGCLWKSLTRGEPVLEATGASVMGELNCGTLLTASWPSLKSGTDASLTISDYEAHLANIELKRLGIEAGPCGASVLAALRRLNESDKSQLGLNKDSVVVLLCTQSTTAYDAPQDVSSDDVISLTRSLIQIDSSNPNLGSIGGPGETSIARYISAWLQHRDIESHWIEPTPGRPSVVGVVRGSGGGKSLMFNGHADTVTLLGYDGDPLSAKVENGNIYGRGSADMKSGLAAAMIALVNAKALRLKGDVILAAVADEEAESIGTEEVLVAGWRADAAIVAEPTEMDIINTHKGLALFEVDIHGLAAHGSRPDLGIDAICKAGYFLVELDRHAQQLQDRYNQGTRPETGAPSIHASVIKGGEEVSSYPARCTISIERRTIAGETPATVEAELQTILEKLSCTIPDFKFDLRNTFARSAYFIARDHPFVNLVAEEATKSTGTISTIRGEAYWTDMALLSDVGIPGVIWGPKGYGLHAKTEWVEIESVRQLTEAFIAIEADFCK